MVNSKVIFPLVTLAVVATGTGANAATVTGDFEDVYDEGHTVDLPKTTQGILFESNEELYPGIFSNPSSGAQNITGNYLAWFNTGDSRHKITASLGVKRFDALSVDAANLEEAGTSIGFVPGMTLKAVGNFVGGGNISQSLTIVEDTVTTFNLVGFRDLASLDFFAPPVRINNQNFAPSPLIDNLVIETEPVHAAGLRFEPSGEMLDDDPILDRIIRVFQPISFEIRLDTTGLTNFGNPFPDGSTLDLDYVFDWDSTELGARPGEWVDQPITSPFGPGDISATTEKSELGGDNKKFVVKYEGLQLGVQDAPLTILTFSSHSGHNLNNDGKPDFAIRLDLDSAKVRDAQGNILGFVGNQLGGNQSVEVQAPEPLTILGSATALGFGALFQREYSKRQKKTKRK